MVEIYVADISNLPDPKEFPGLMEELTEERKQKTLRYTQELGRKQSMGAGLLLQAVLFRHGREAKDICFGKNGKPEMDGICFNLSHSQELVACAVSEKRVGCDAEKIENAPKGIAKRFFCEREIEYLEAFQNGEKDREFFRLWTMKESYMKMTGEGMHLSLKGFEIVMDDSVKIYRDGERCSCFIKEYVLPKYRLTVCAEEEEFAEKVEYICLPKNENDSIIR